MVLTLALNYSARSELVDAFRSIVNAAAQNGGFDHLQIDEIRWPGICIHGIFPTLTW